MTKPIFNLVLLALDLDLIIERVEFIEPKQKDAQDWNAAASGPMDYFGEGGRNHPGKLNRCSSMKKFRFKEAIQ